MLAIKETVNKRSIPIQDSIFRLDENLFRIREFTGIGSTPPTVFTKTVLIFFWVTN